MDSLIHNYIKDLTEQTKLIMCTEKGSDKLVVTSITTTLEYTDEKGIEFPNRISLFMLESIKIALSREYIFELDTMSGHFYADYDMDAGTTKKNWSFAFIGNILDKKVKAEGAADNYLEALSKFSDRMLEECENSKRNK